MTKIQLHRQVCAFIDVLGGATLFRGKDRRRARTFFACLEEFERRMNGWSWQFPKKRQSRALVKTFSDNIFVAFPLGSHHEVSDEEVVGIFLHELTGQITELTLYAEFPVRGAVTVGPLMFSEKFLFGPALVEAVELEKAALFPRILLSPSVLRFIDPAGKDASFVLRDADGHAFLDYLGRRLSHGADLRSHQKFVINGLAENRSRVRERQKYEWLAQYHNFHAVRHGLEDQLIQINPAAGFTPFAEAVGPATDTRDLQTRAMESEADASMAHAASTRRSPSALTSD